VLMALWRRFNLQLILWREVALPGLLLIIIVLLIRWIGLLQVQEWMAFDTLSRSCPASMAKSSIMIIGIDEADLNAVGGFPVPDQTLVDLVTTLQGHQPAVIGLDLFRAKPVQPGHEALVNLLTQSPNLVGVEVALNSKTDLNIKPPSMLPLEQIGFVDAMADEDGKLRRMTLASSVPEQSRLKYSFVIQLVKRYLEMKGIPFHAPIHNPVQFGSFKFDSFKPNSGAYIRADAAGKQILLNFCANQRLYPTLSLTDVLQRNFAPELIRDRIIIIGMTAPSVRDVFFISALKETLASSLMGKLLPTTQLIYGVEAQAHAADQLVNAVLGNQPQIRVWEDIWEYLWIAGWGLLGIFLGVLLRSPWKSLVSLTVATVTLISLSLFALMLGWWIPLVPSGLALGGAGMITTFFDRDLRFEPH
jgi:CHASE2 domain-containing sensor protein